MKIGKILLTGTALGALVATPAMAQERWDMALAYAASNYHSETAADFAEAVNAAQDEIEIVTHPSGSLFPGGEIYGAVRRGLVPIGERLISALANEDPLFEIDALPFLATSFDEARTLYEVSRPALEEILAEQGMVFLYSVPWPPQGLYSITPVVEIEDMEGLRFRAYNAATSRIAELAGAVPTQIEAAELSQAFATGVAESMISSGSTGYDRQIWEHVDYWYDIQAWLPRNMVMVNAGAWEALSEDTRDIILAEAAAAEEAGWATAEELSDWYKEQLAAEGMTIEPPSDQLAADFAEIGETMAAEWMERADERGIAVLEAYRDAAN